MLKILKNSLEFARKFAHYAVFGVLFTCASTVSFALNTDKGQQLSISCQGCHGADGNSLAPEWPHLAAQHPSYIKKQILNFQKGERKNDIMSSMTAGLKAEDIDEIAAYFSSQNIKPQEQELSSSSLVSGKKIYKGGNIYTGVPACASCHAPSGKGNEPAGFPRLAGQRVDYLVKTLNDFKSGQRNNDYNEIMQSIAKKMTDSEIRSVAAFISTME